jgi:hypothetical protein
MYELFLNRIYENFIYFCTILLLKRDYEDETVFCSGFHF